MHILYIGKFNYGHNTEQYVEHALKSHGVQVTRRPFTGSMTFTSLKAKIDRTKPDVVLFSKPAAPCFLDIIQYCRRIGVLTVCWQWDLFWGYRRHRLPQFHADLLFTTDGGHDKNWKIIEANHRVLRQGIHAPDRVLFESTEWKYDVAFVGNRTAYRERKGLVTWLERTYGDRFIHHTNTRGLDLNKALSEVKVVVGDSFPSRAYWSNRVYEIIGRGGFLLFPETPGLEAEFTEGLHYSSYKRGNRKDLQSKIAYWIRNDEDREKVRRKGFEHCENYTYSKRVEELLHHINSVLTSLPAADSSLVPGVAGSLLPS